MVVHSRKPSSRLRLHFPGSHSQVVEAQPLRAEESPCLDLSHHNLPMRVFTFVPPLSPLQMSMFLWKPCCLRMASHRMKGTRVIPQPVGD